MGRKKCKKQNATSTSGIINSPENTLVVIILSLQQEETLFLTNIYL
jgi:hypothetical protein